MRSWLLLAVALVGCGLIVAGVGMWAGVPAAFIVAGVVLVLVAYTVAESESEGE